MVSNQLLALNDAEDSISDYLESLSSQFRELEELTFDANFDCQLFRLWLDVGVEDALTLLVHNHDPGHVLLPLWCRMSLT